MYHIGAQKTQRLQCQIPLILCAYHPLRRVAVLRVQVNVEHIWAL